MKNADKYKFSIAKGTYTGKIFTGSKNADTITATSTTGLTINAGNENDFVTSSGKNSTINGGAGNDTLYGGTGNDHSFTSRTKAPIPFKTMRAATCCKNGSYTVCKQ
ncbi:MAG: hypothetical protein IJQ85_07305 [Selenomonadaceae bacterium]|nr:hypothetical protein [Selenomonadaceae bacterium]